MSLDYIVSVYGWPLTLITGFAVIAFLFFMGRRLLDSITGKKRD